MAPRKQLANGATSVPVATSEPILPTSKLPAELRFPLVLALNLSLSALLYSFASEFTAGDLSSVSRSINTWWEIGTLVAFRVVELAVGWWGEYDGYDLASLTLLTHTPPLFLLTSFYSIRLSTLLISLAVDTISFAIPFQLLRPIHPTHDSLAPPKSVRNRSIISDLPVQAYTSLLATSLYALAIYTAYSTYLPVHLITSFDALSSLELAHDPQLLLKLLISFLPLGFAAKTFLFTPSTGARPDVSDARVKAFDPETSGLGETVWYNVWGYDKRTRECLTRTVTLAAMTLANTWLQTYFSIEGAESWGALGYALAWTAAASNAGLALWWVADIEGVRN